MSMTVVAVSEAMRTDVQHPGPVDRMVLDVGAGASVKAVAGLERLFLGLWLVPWFRCRLCREVAELCLDVLFFGQKQLGGSDGVSGRSILPLELLMLHHQEDLFVGGTDEVPGC